MCVAHEPKVACVLDQAGRASHGAGQGVAQLHVQLELPFTQPVGLGLGLGPGKDHFTKSLRCYLQGFPGTKPAFHKGGQSFSLHNPAPNLGTAIVRLSP